jgi:hypothetical protein
VFFSTKMSFVKKMPATPVKSQFQLELVPNPAVELSKEEQVAQKNMINRIQSVSNGLFLPNPAVCVNGAIKSGQIYNRSVKVADLLKPMQDHNLVMRVTIAGEHTACAMATAEDLKTNAVVNSPSGSFSLGVRNGYIRDIDFI